MKIFGLSIRSSHAARYEAEDLRYYKKRYLWKVGSTMLVPGSPLVNYRLLSTNGGRDWYAVDKHDAIIGHADEVYPGLLTHIAGLESLISHVEAHGPIDLAHAEGRRLLRGAGFEITQAG